MIRRAKGLPKRYVTFDGASYAVRSSKIELPDFATMDRLSVRLWLLKNTHPRGYTRPNPLAGFAGVISVSE